MSDIATLGIAVDSRGVRNGERDLQGLSAASRKAEKAIAALVVAFVGFATVKLISVSRQFDIINASLVTATGSAEKASVAFEAIQDFAATTPFALGEVATAFVKLRNLGLDPSEKALVSFGNTASAMGKSLDQLIEAVADATVGEFERLKEFGIKARKQGDEVSFTFQGVTETIKNNSLSIQEYLEDLGNNQFAGAMALRADTLDGAISNLGDSWDQLFLTISSQGVGSLITDGVRSATDAIGELTDFIASGQLFAVVAAMGNQFDKVFTIVADGFSGLAPVVGGSFESIELSTNRFIGFMIDAFSNLPTNITAFIQIMTIELLAFIDQAAAYTEEIGRILNPKNWIDDQSVSALDGTLQNIKENRLGLISDILSERQESIASFKADISLANEARDAYDKARLARINAGEDRLAGFALDLPTGKGGGGDSKASAQKKYNKALSEGRNIFNSTRTAVELYNIALSEAKSLLDLGAISTDTYARQLKILSEDFNNLHTTQTTFIDAGKAGFVEYSDGIGNAFDNVEKAGANAMQSLEDTLLTFVTTSKLNFSDMVNSIAADLARIAIQENITKPLSGALSDALSGGFGGLFGGGFPAGATGGATPFVREFAKGGVPSLSSFTNSVVSSPTAFAAGGTPYNIVGEAGAEAILPLTRTSSGNLGVESTGGGGSVVVQNNVSIINQAGVQVEETGRKENQSGGIDIEMTITKMVSSGLQRGAFDKGLKGRFNLSPRGA